MASPMAAVCIRCGSKDHTTREHDERKGGTGAKEKPKPKLQRPASAVEGDGKRNKYAITKVVHPKCFQAGGRNIGIPDVIDKPVRERFYQDPCAENWGKRGICECQACEKKRNRRRIEQSRRQPHLPAYTG